MSRLQQPSNDPTDDVENLSCRMTIQDVRTALDVVGRCDHGSDETLASKELAEKAIINGTGKLEAILNVSLEVVLTKKGETAELPSSRAWTLPSTIFQLSPGRRVLKKHRVPCS